VFQAKNLDLPRRVRFKRRKQRYHTAPSLTGIQNYKRNRMYNFSQAYMKMFPDTDVVEMDTVKGTRTAGKCVLTLLFRKSSFMLIILLPRCTQKIEKTVRAKFAPMFTTAILICPIKRDGLKKIMSISAT